MQISEYILLDNLFEIYGSLLSERQRTAVHLHVCEDLSLAETAEQMGVTRQAVSDALQTAKSRLTEYEDRLHLLAVTRAYDELYTLIEEDASDRIKSQAAAVYRLLKNETED